MRLGWYTVPRKFGGSDGLAIPIVREGRTINHKYRGPRDGGKKRISQDEGAPRAFWNEDVLRDPSLSHLPVVIWEGEMDGATGVQTAEDLVRNIGVADGANSNLDFFEHIQELLDGVPRFILGGHNDPAGRQLNQELARRLGAARCAWLDWPDGCKDSNEVLQASGRDAVRALIKLAKPYPIKGLYRLSDFPEVNLELRDTGWPNLNHFLKLWVPELMVMTGIPQHGKSKFMLHMMMQQAEQYGSKCALFTPEVPVKPHVRSEMRKFYGKTDEEADAWIDEHFVFLHCDPADIEDAADIPWIIDKAGDAIVRYGISWLGIDPWNQVEHNRGSMSSAEYQEKMLKQLNIFRNSMECGVIVAAHPTKGVLQKDGKVRVPTLYDIDGSAHWYNAPDHGVVVDRPNSSGRDVRVIIKKSRFFMSGVCGEAWLRYDAEIGRFRPLLGAPEVER